MKLQILILLAVALVTGGLMLADYRHGVPVEAQGEKSVKGAKAQLSGAAAAPDFTITPMNAKSDAQPQKLSELKGRFVLINAWASWCPPCVHEFPDLLTLAKDYPSKLVLVTLSADRNKEAALAFLSQFDAPSDNMLHMFDARQKIARDMLQIHRYPESILIGKNGEMLRKYAGLLTQEDLAEIKALINAAE